MTEKTCTARIQKEGDDLFLVLPLAFLDEIGWRLGDQVEWGKDETGTITIQRVNVEPPKNQ